ncbi:MAG TPA: GFA family protein [Gammaproteobacteria bacterium]|nr:GFA family protein [Gammaproteobacteria bacterium]
MTINGSCFCGEIKYIINGTLTDITSCHCSMCRKAFSSQASAFAHVNSDEFSWLLGESLLSTYESKTGAGIQFCSKCGSTLCGTNKGKVIGITLGCIEGDPEIKIEKHIFVGSKASWEIIPDGVPKYEEWPPKNA